jgi:hypothetical protein
VGIFLRKQDTRKKLKNVFARPSRDTLAKTKFAFVVGIWYNSIINKTKGNQMARTVNPNPTPLTERVCKRGHIGQYRKRGVRTLACHPCQKLANARFKERGGTFSPELSLQKKPLTERVCKRGHIGQYRLRGKNSIVCHECSKIALARFTERKGA